MKSKTIILSSEAAQGRGILTLYQENDLLQCRLRLYNIEKLTRHCKIGVYHENEVYSANLLEKNGAYTSSMVGTFDIDKDFYTAIIDTQNNNNVIISGGTYAGFFFNDESVFEEKFNKIEKTNPDTHLFDYDTTLNEETRNTIGFNEKAQDLSQGSQRSTFSASHEIKEQSLEHEVCDEQTLKERELRRCNSDRNVVKEDHDCDKCTHCKYKEYFYQF